MQRIHAVLAALTTALVLAACSDSTVPGPGSPAPPDTVPGIVEYTYQVVNQYPHDTQAYTQGLVWVDSVLIEGTGPYFGPSTLRRVHLETGSVLQSRIPPNPFVFGEGVTVVGDRIFQLTWTDKLAWAYDAATFDSLAEYHYDTQGWGLTHDGTRLIMSDGTPHIYFRDLDTFAVLDTITVSDDEGPVVNLNELEYINGLIWANVWQTYTIVMIDPDSGRVVARLDCEGILRTPQFNGIAFDAENGRLFVTGKLWAWLFEIRLVRKP